ncbi:hypothetical protein BDC45DRAFT_517569 [Circinella umbellata]|nr:hypothetical protein BDC45DRAFT_517569 [Circinella umbellata]
MSTEQDSSEANTIPYDPNASFSASLSNESLEQQQQREQNESDHTNNSSVHPSNNSTVSTTGYHGDTEGPSQSLSSSHSQQRSSSSGQRSDQSQRIKENSNEFSQPFPRTKSYEGSFEHLNRENDRLLRDGNEHGSQNSMFTPPEIASLKRGNTFPYDRPSKIAAKALEERDGIKSQNNQGSQILGPVEHLPEGCERIRTHRNVATTILKNQTSVSRRRRQAAQTIRNPTVLSREHIREQLGVPPPKQHENSDQSNNSPSPLNYPESPSTRYRPGEGESSSSQPSSLLHSSSSLSEDRLSTTSSQLERYLLIHGESWTPGHYNNDDNEAAYDLDSDDESISYGESDMETWRDKSPEIGFSELHIRREKESNTLQNEKQAKKHGTTTATTANTATTTTTISKGKSLPKKQLKKQSTTVTTAVATSSTVPEKNSSPSPSSQNPPKRRSSRRQQQLQQKQKGQKIYLSNTVDEQKVSGDMKVIKLLFYLKSGNDI